MIVEDSPAALRGVRCARAWVETSQVRQNKHQAGDGPRQTDATSLTVSCPAFGGGS